MDGEQAQVSRSLRFRLSIGLSLLILILALAASAWAYRLALDEANELQDNSLRQMGAALARVTVKTLGGPPVARADVGEPEAPVWIWQRGTDAREVLPAGAPNLPPLSDGLQTVHVDSASYRVWVKHQGTHGQLVVAQSVGVRDDIAEDSAWRAVMPLLVLIPLLILVVTVLVHRLFRPVTDLAQALDQRSELDLQSLPVHAMPAEIRPFVAGINRLLLRMQRAIQVQHRFVADAAHELRTPLTAMSLQAERLGAADMSAEARTRLQELQLGIARNKALLTQLLGLARAQSSLGQEVGCSISLVTVYRQVLADLQLLAEAKGIGIHVDGDEEAMVWADELDVYSLLRNVLDNAVRYTPGGGQVGVILSMAAGVTTLMVADTGPGIPEAEWVRVFEPFYRLQAQDVAGSGLGLAIVQALAERMRASLTLGFTEPHTRQGLRVTVVFPSASPPATC